MKQELEDLYESFLSIKDAFKVVQKSNDSVLLKTKYAGLTIDEKRKENEKALEHSGELIILSMFALFERKIRYLLIDNIQNFRVSSSRELQERFLRIVEDKMEFLEINKLLKMFDFIPDIEHGRIKQIAKYRNWLVHGKNQNKLPPNRALTARTVLEELSNYIQKLERVFVQSTTIYTKQ